MCHKASRTDGLSKGEGWTGDVNGGGERPEEENHLQLDRECRETAERESEALCHSLE